MTREELISINEAEAWREALTGIPHAFAHTWEYVKAWSLSFDSSIAGQAEPAVWLYVFQQAGVRRVCPLAERVWNGRRDIVTPYGFSGFAGNRDCADSMTHWRRFAAEREWVCGYIGLHPILDDSVQYGERERPGVGGENCSASVGSLTLPVLHQDRAFRFDQVHIANHVYELDLTQSEKQLAEGLSRNARERLRDWQKSGARLVYDQERLRQFFIAQYHSFTRRIGASAAYDFSIATLDELMSLERVFLVGAENTRAELEAVSVFGYTAHCGEYLFNVSLPEGRYHSAALLWEGLLQLKSRAVPVANLGGGIKAGDGLDQFKARFGGRQRPLRALRQIYQPEAYLACCREAGVDPLTQAGYFPPYRAQLPRVAAAYASLTPTPAHQGAAL